MDKALAGPDEATAMSSSPPALRLLSLDGGGIRGISALVILDEIMHRFQRAENLPSTPLPADYFDLICGTSTGGLIALLLGRLRLSVPEAMEKYRVLAKQVFSEKKGPGKDGIFKASNLEKAIKAVVEEKLGAGRAEETMWEDVGGCKTFVCAVAARHVNKEPMLFRTWSADKDPGYNCKIWEAGRATAAAPRFFKRIFIGDIGIQEEFIDAALGCNNPVRYLVKEAQREFGSMTPMREVGCIVSIGTGVPKVASFEAPGFFQRALPIDLVKVLARMATDAEDEAKRAKERYKSCPSLYHRLNVERGLENVSLEEWKKLGDVKTHTTAYLRGDQVSNDIDVIVRALAGKSLQTFALGHLDGAFQGSSHNLSRFIYPTYRVNHFVPRVDLQKDIQKWFRAPSTTALPTVVILHGIGGCGKSQLALEYCQQSEHGKSYSAIFWIDAMSPSTVEQSFTFLAQELSMPGFDAKNTEANLQFVLERLRSSPGRWLLVFDNFDDPPSFRAKSIKEYFPRRSKGSILITSRAGEATFLGHAIDVSVMSDEEAIELLFQRMQRDEETRSNMDLLEARKIVERLGFHALAIDQAGAYIFSGGYDLDVFLYHYSKRRKEVLSAKPSLWDYRRKLQPDSDFETELTVFTTWELSFNLITGDQRVRDDKEHILTLMAFLHGNKISDTLFKTHSSEDSSWMTSCTQDGVWDEFKFQDILKEMRNLSLIQSLQIQRSGATISLHPLIQDWIKLRISPEAQWAYATEAIRVVSSFLGCQEFHKIALDDRQTTTAHIDAVVQNEQECLRQHDHNEDDIVLDGYHNFFGFYFESGQYKRAEKLCRYERKRSERLYGAEHPDTLTSTRNLALLLDALGEHKECEQLTRQTLALTERVRGKEHPETLGSINNLAIVLQHQGKYDEAEPLFRQALALSKKVLGSEHPDTLKSTRNLADLLAILGKHKESEQLARQSLAIIERVRGKEHPETLNNINILAVLLHHQGKYDKAEPLYRQALALAKKVLGPEHPETLWIMNNLAVLHQHQGKYNKAEPLYRQIIALREEVFGPRHPNTLTSIDNLAGLLQIQGKYDKAEPLSRKALALMEEILGPSHPDTLSTKNNLASLLSSQGKDDEAEPLFRQILALREELLGPRHPGTLISINNLAYFLERQGEYDEAELLYLKALALGEEALGPDHPNTLRVKNNLTRLLETRGTAGADLASLDNDSWETISGTSIDEDGD